MKGNARSGSAYVYTYYGPFVAGRYGYTYYNGVTIIEVNYGTGAYYYDYQYMDTRRNPQYVSQPGNPLVGVFIMILSTKLLGMAG